MKFLDPDWVGEVVRCDRCAVRFTLEAEDKDKVTFSDRLDDGRDRYYMHCPKCNRFIYFYIDPIQPKPNARWIEAEIISIEEETLHRRRLLE